MVFPAGLAGCKNSVNIDVQVDGAGSVVSIFLGNNSWKATFTVAATDFFAFALEIEKNAALFSSNHDQNMFFRAIASGCSD